MLAQPLPEHGPDALADEGEHQHDQHGRRRHREGVVEALEDPRGDLDPEEPAADQPDAWRTSRPGSPAGSR